MKEIKKHITIIAKEDTTISWNAEKGCFEFFNSEGELSTENIVSIGEAYDRDNKHPKVVREFDNPSGSRAPVMSNPDIKYDKYVTIDTSYKIFGENYLCAIGGLRILNNLSQFDGIKKGDELFFAPLPRLVFLAKGNINPEKYGWARLILALQELDDFDINEKYGIVVDSELGLIPKINAKEIPVLDDIYVANNMKLVYASADTGKSFFVNKLIQCADKIASSSLSIALDKFKEHQNTTFDKEFYDVGVLNDEEENKQLIEMIQKTL